MRLVPFQLIPDQGSVGYKLYQEAQKAKAEAVTPKNTAIFMVESAEPQRTMPDPIIEETDLPEEENVAAMTAFLNAAKIKYKEAGDRTPVYGVSTIGGSISYTAEEIRKMWGNPFVVNVRATFDSIIFTLESYERHILGVEKLQAKIAEGDMSYVETIAMSQSMLEERKASLEKQLYNLKAGMENLGNEKEAHEFFGEYTEFTRGEKLSLQKLFSDFSVV